MARSVLQGRQPDQRAFGRGARGTHRGDGRLTSFTLDFCRLIYQKPITNVNVDVFNVITAGQIRASRALLGIDQRRLAELCGLSLPTIQRMEASEGVVRGNVDSLMKLIAALDTAGIELISAGSVSAAGGRGVRLKAVAS